MADKSPALARCPGCGKRRDVEKQKALRQVEEVWFAHAQSDPSSPFHPKAGGMRLLAVSNNPRWFWACDACVKAGRALVADITKQNLGIGTPFAAYVDRPFCCEDCRSPSVFSAGEQRHWFEELGFLIWVYPKQCAACRHARRRKGRANKSLAEALQGLDPNDSDQLEVVARLYDELGSARKATEFRSRAKNRRRK